MASSLQLRKDWQELVKQKTELSAEVDLLSKKRDALKKESLRFEEERRQIEKDLSEREASVKQREQHINVSLARTESTIRKDIERLNDEVIAKQSEIKRLDIITAERRNTIKQLEKTLKSLGTDINRLQRVNADKAAELEQLRHKTELEREAVAGIVHHLAQAQAELQRVSEETRNLTKLKHDLDMYYMRIKNYYKKAGLNFIDEQHVGIPSN